MPAYQNTPKDKGGRPRRGAYGSVHVTLSETVDKRTRALAERQEMTISAVVEAALRAYLKSTRIAS